MIPSDTAFFERQAPLTRTLGDHLIDLTPDHWREAILQVTVEIRPDRTQAMDHTITSPEGHRDTVVPDDTLFEHTRRLYLLFAEYEQAWQGATCHVSQKADESWRIKIHYTYPQASLVPSSITPDSIAPHPKPWWRFW